MPLIAPSLMKKKQKTTMVEDQSLKPTSLNEIEQLVENSIEKDNKETEEQKILTALESYSVGLNASINDTIEEITEGKRGDKK
jgi:hypothetical protein